MYKYIYIYIHIYYISYIYIHIIYIYREVDDCTHFPLAYPNILNKSVGSLFKDRPLRGSPWGVGMIIILSLSSSC